MILVKPHYPTVLVRSRIVGGGSGHFAKQMPQFLCSDEAGPSIIYAVAETDALNQNMIEFILSDAGRLAVDELDSVRLSKQETLTVLSRLRRKYSAAEAGAILALASLRRRAAAKFPDAERLFFTAEALEQATAWDVAQFRARWIDQRASAGAVLDLGCGIGGDTLALAQRRPVIAYETDPVRLRFAKANAFALGLAGQCDFRLADWTAELVAENLPTAAAAFADPARRVASATGRRRRIFRLDEMVPPIGTLLRLQRQIPALGIKVMPGVDNEQLPNGCDVEFVSHEGTCKEAILWFGALRGHEGGQRRATILRQSAETFSIEALGQPPPVGELASGQFLHEPDPALIRAGAFAELCNELGGHLFDPMIAYVMSESVDAHPLTQSFLIREVHPMSLALLNRRLRALGVGQVEMKKRGVPIEPEELRRRLKLAKKGEDAVVIFTRRGDDRLMLIGRRVSGKG